MWGVKNLALERVVGEDDDSGKKYFDFMQTHALRGLKSSGGTLLWKDNPRSKEIHSDN